MLFLKVKKPLRWHRTILRGTRRFPGPAEEGTGTSVLKIQQPERMIPLFQLQRDIGRAVPLKTFT